MFNREFNYVIFFCLIGMGSFVFGIDLLLYGFGPIYYKLPYSPYSKFDKLRFYESGIESIFSGKYDLIFYDLFPFEHICNLL